MTAPHSAYYQQYLPAATALIEECYRKDWMSEATWQDIMRLLWVEEGIDAATLARLFADGVAVGCPIEQQLVMYRAAFREEGLL